MSTILISGAGSGIGHAFLMHYAKDSSNTIHALDVTWSNEISNQKSAAKVHRHTVNSASQESLDKLISELGEKTPVDLFIHSAAVRGLNPEITKKSENPADAETLDVTTPEVFEQTLTINTLGTFLLIRTLLPNLRLSSRKPPKVIIMGSGMGSITNNTGGAYAYGASKAGLNYVVKSFAGDVPEVVFGIIHPGKVDSRMTHVREEGSIDPDEAVGVMLPVMEGIGRGDLESGCFVTREGKAIPW